MEATRERDRPRPSRPQTPPSRARERVWWISSTFLVKSCDTVSYVSSECNFPVNVVLSDIESCGGSI